jgi:RNA polymerase sigma factor (sigma-70 family)
MKSSNKIPYFNNKDVEEKILLFQQTGDPVIIDELVPTLKKLIAGVIGKYKLLRRNYINDDLYQEAWVGIMEVVGKWNPERGTAFSYLTGVVRNKIFWYLKNHYHDTSVTSDDTVKISLDDHQNDKTYQTSVNPQNLLNEANDFMIKDYLKKLTIDDLSLPENDNYDIILESIKAKILSNDNIIYEDLIRETQKELVIPKKQVRELLDAIYNKFIGE